MTVDTDVATASDAVARIEPLTERVLHRLGRPRWLWILLWAMVPLVSPLVFSTAVRLSGRPFGESEFVDLATTQAVLAFACLVFLWGGGLLGGQATDLRVELRSIAPRRDWDVFSGIGSARGPMVLTGVVALIVSASGGLEYGPLPPLAALLPLVVYALPILTFVWVYLVILVDLHRLGRSPLLLDVFPQDRTLGLERFGSLASTGLSLLLAAAVPVLIAGSDEAVTLGISLAIVAVAVATFLLSMWGLHRQMAVAKAGYVALARRLYADAYAPVRADPRIETLADHGNALSAARALDERANDLPTWPVDEGTLRTIAVVITGVVTSMIVRGLFAALGA